MKRNTRHGFTLVELMVVIGILGLLVGILAVAVIPRMTEAKSKMETKQMADLYSAFQEVNTDRDKARRIRDLGDASGREFYEGAFKRKIFRADLLSKIISLGTTTDSTASTEFIEDPEGKLEEYECSYTAPKAKELGTVMKKQGSERKVVITFNSRNWNNYDGEVLVQMSDGSTSEYILAVDAVEKFDIDASAWKDNPADIIGKKAPFDKTFE